MLKLRRIDRAARELARTAAAWRQRGFDVSLETPSRGGVWLPVAEAGQRWKGWLQPRDWLEHVAPKLAGLAASAGTGGLVVNWLSSVAQPLRLPIEELAYQRLSVGEPVPGERLPQGPMLRVMGQDGPLWLERAPGLDSPGRVALDAMTWPLRFVLGYSRLSVAFLEKVACGDLLLISELTSTVRCHDRTLGFFEINEDEIVMELQERGTAVQDDEGSLTGMDKLPVQLEFVLHRTRISLADLQKQGAAMLMPLPADAELKVEVRANGALVGRGELVQLDEQLGVELTEWLGGAGDVE